MIREILTKKKNPALTSDAWHVVHARWDGTADGEPRFVRHIVSEHTDRPTAVEAARGVIATLQAEMAAREPAVRDQIFVRRPAFETLVTSGRVLRRRA